MYVYIYIYINKRVYIYIYIYMCIRTARNSLLAPALRRAAADVGLPHVQPDLLQILM